MLNCTFDEMVGDSTAHLSATALTYDHHPDREDERARIEAAGGSVTNWGVPRVSGVLAMSRSIGDVYLKRQVSSSLKSFLASLPFRLFLPCQYCSIMSSFGIQQKVVDFGN